MTRAGVRAAMRSSLLCLMLAAAANVSGETIAKATQYRITGVLVSSTDGSPIRHGHLEATLAGSGRRAGQRLSASNNEAEADDNGRFVLSLPSAGMWDLVASAPGFVRQGYLEHVQFMTAVVLTNAAPAMDLRFALSPNVQISGTVTDEAGEAVRGAQVSLMRLLPETPGRTEPAAARARAAQTDDRGVYEFDDLPPGSYRICVQAQPWYAVAAALSRQSLVDGSPPLDPSLDVAYPATWYPGSDNPNTAETLVLKGGDIREADVRLMPVPSLHILVDPPSSGVQGFRRGVPFMPIVQKVNSGAGPMNYIQATMSRTSQGQIDVGGLTPGLYEVQMGGPAGDKRSVVRVTADGTQTVSFDADSGEAEVSFHIAGLPEAEARSLQVALIDPESRQVLLASTGNRRFSGGFSRLRGAPAPTEDKASDPGTPSAQTLNVPAGRYEVVIQGRPDLYLTGIEAKGANATGRSVTLPVGASTLTLHVAEGRASLTGFAKLNGKASVGAVVMLVPATLGETGALQIVQRDQSNSDGSFNMAGIIPGQYILIAVENGWGINWADASTMQRYLTQGVPVELAAGSDIATNVTAQEP